MAAPLLAAVLVPGVAGAAVAPNPAFLPYKNCPAKSKGVKICVLAITTSGEVKLGSKSVPITQPITLQGGTTEQSEQLVGATNGETVASPPEPVPGGLTGIEGVGGELLAQTELAGEPSAILVNEGNDLDEKGIAVELPLKVKLENTLLGEECLVGSNASPILLHLTTGTTTPPSPNTPISGSKGNLTKIEQENTILTYTGVKLVDNSFSAPAATGCGGAEAFLINPIVNEDAGLPSASGNNTAKLEGSLSVAFAFAVRKAHVLPKPPRK